MNAGSNQRSMPTSAGDVIYLVTGKDAGKPAWYYLKVHKLKLPLLLRESQRNKEGRLDLQSYGVVIKYGWGEMPPQSVQNEIEVTYG